MIAHQRPFPQGSVVNSEPMGLRSVAPQAPEHWARAISRVLSKNPASRPSTAGAFVDELRKRKSSLKFSLPHASRRTFLATAGTGITVALFFGIRRYQSRGQIESPLVMMTPLVAIPEYQSAAESLAVQIGRGLEQSQRVRLFDRQRIPSIWRLMSRSSPVPEDLDARTTREIALRGGADFVLSGSYSWDRKKRSRTLKLTLDRMGNTPEFPLESHRTEFLAENDADLLRIGGDAAQWVRATAGEAAGEIAAHTRPFEQITTKSWEALREYTAGESAWRNHSEAGLSQAHDAAEVHLIRALHLDSDFAMAAARLADIQMASDEVSDAVGNYQHAIEIIDRLNFSDRESLRIVGIFALDSDRFEEAEAAFTRYALEYPHDSLPLFYKAGAVAALGRTEEALNLYDYAIRKDPEVYSYRNRRAITLLSAGRFQEAEDENERAARLDNRNWTDQVRGALAFARRDMPGVVAALDRLRQSPSNDFVSKSFLLRACLRAEQEEWLQAEASIQEGLRYDRANGQFEGSRSKMLALAQLYLLQNKMFEAIATCREILSQTQDLRSILDAGGILGPAVTLRWPGCACPASKFSAARPLTYPVMRTGFEDCALKLHWLRAIPSRPLPKSKPLVLPTSGFSGLNAR